ncbi:putative neural-cadherin 2 [Palaemon carinicauda]|uniref:putative neural-cadherin 2 n=1 Tax=Palaemon carinicauda TaxID=392227 RepID=UPI0035B6A753
MRELVVNSSCQFVSMWTRLVCIYTTCHEKFVAKRRAGVRVPNNIVRWLTLQETIDCATVRYSITGGNKDGLFTIDQHSGLITLSATLDYELQRKHELVVAAEAEGGSVHSFVAVSVADINDNPPRFLHNDAKVTILEGEDEDLPKTIFKVVAEDADSVDTGRLIYSVGGEGVSAEHSDAEPFFSINPHSGELLQLKALDRDPPKGKASWQLRVQVRDGQRVPSSLAEATKRLPRKINRSRHLKQEQTIKGQGLPPSPALPPPPPSQTKENQAISESFSSGTSLLPASSSSTSSSSTATPIFADHTREIPYRSVSTYSVPLSFPPHRGGEEPHEGDRNSNYIMRNNVGSSSDGRSLQAFKQENNIRKHISLRKNFVFKKSKPTQESQSEMDQMRTTYSPKLSDLTKSNHELETEVTERISEKQSSTLTDLESIEKNVTKEAKRIIILEKNLMNNTLASEREDLFRDKRTTPQTSPSENRNLQTSIRIKEVDIPRSYHDDISIFKRSILPGLVGDEALKTETPTELTGLLSKRKDFAELDSNYSGKRFSTDDVAGCEDYTSFSFNFGDIPYGKRDEKDGDIDLESDLGSHMLGADDETGHVHVVETIVTVVVKDLNDNPPLFPNVTIIGEVQENGPIDLSVAVVTAWDADDIEEGTNAQLTYSIAKNVLEERTGQAIFAINPDTGLLTTAVCCLDRETTPEYHIQVVAVDGGGLTGTGQVVVRLADVNDNSPRLSRDLWEVDVKESWRGEAPSNRTLAQFTTVDHDISNYFFYRVVEESGWGWQYFEVRSRGHIGELYSTHPLDYEDSAHKRGFRFMIQVTDRGRGGWDDPRHTDTAWVSVHLVDINDNPPQFSQPQIHLTLQENVVPGTVLTNLVAHDPDMGGKQQVRYSIVGGWDALKVNDDGVVRLWRALDREMAGGDVGVAKVIAVDDGIPPLSSTATLTITVTDVNDCPPRLLPPTLLHVTEGRPTTRLGLLRATDDDVWALGHGPPFFFSLPPSNPAAVFHMLALKYNSSEDSGRGGAEIWTRGAIDREHYPQMAVDIEVSDAGGLSATQQITLVVDDINDNPMKPASKKVYLWKTQGGGSEASLGRVYVEDPDDWDLEDKTFSWHGPAHPLFSLHSDTGAIFASAHVREGRYDLKFSVSDRVWGQTDIRANVTVDVRYLHQDALNHALPLTLTPITPTALTKGWSPKHGGGGLGTLAKIVKKIIGSPKSNVEIVSVYGHPESDAVYSPALPKATPLVHSPGTSFTCVWLSVREQNGVYVDPVKLQGLLSLHNRKLEKEMSVGVSLKEPGSEAGFGASLMTISSISNPQQPPSLASLASTALPLQVVDTNTTSLVTPRLSRSHACPVHREDEISDSCTSTSCLNGGRCVRNAEGNSRCICPGGSWGRRCKIVSRTFEGKGWIWIRAFPPCLPTTISLRVLTRRPNALLLYSGPLSFSSTHPRYPTTPMLSLQLVEGRPQVLMESGRGSIRLQVDSNFEMGLWHTLHLHIDAQGVTLMLDLCDWGWVEGAKDDSHCRARASWENASASDDWIGTDPVQVGGLSHERPSPQQYGWSWAPIAEPLEGCISQLTVNGEMIDLGEPAYSTNSWTGCRPQDAACKGKCGLNGRCTGGIANPWCDCDPGWAPPVCDVPTIPASLNKNSYVKMAISFTPDPYNVATQMRVRAIGRPSGLLVKFENHRKTVSFVIRLRSGVVCASLSAGELDSPESCVDGYPLGDGSWHTVYIERHGPNMLISVDDGDGWRHNHTFATFLKPRMEHKRENSIASGSQPSSVTDSTSFERPMPLIVDKQNGLTVGGVPEYQEAELINVHNDVSEICIDDLRVSGKGLPLPPGVNGTTWGQVTTFQNIESNCPSRDHCSNTSCLPPLTCHNTWRQASCSCGPGRQLLGGTCQLMNECGYQPCLHGGTCRDMHPGYQCTCQPYHRGDNCQWVHLPPPSHSVTPVVIAAITLSILLFVVIGVVVTLRLHKSRTGRNGELRPAGVEGASEVGGIATVIETPITSHATKRKEEPVLLDALKLKVQAEQHSFEGKISPSLSCKGIGSKEGFHHTPSLRRSTVGHEASKDIVTSSLKLPPRVTLCSGDDSSKDKSPAESPGTSLSSRERPRVAVVCGNFSTNPPPAQDDLRAYAYEGDGSPSGSLTSATVGLQMEIREEDPRPILTEYDEVYNLLTQLPDAPNRPITPLSASQDCLSKQEIGFSPLKSLSGMVSDMELSSGQQRRGSEIMNEFARRSSSDVTRRSSDVMRCPSDVTRSSTDVTRRKSSLKGLSTPC